LDDRFMSGVWSADRCDCNWTLGKIAQAFSLSCAGVVLCLVGLLFPSRTSWRWRCCVVQRGRCTLRVGAGENAADAGGR
jgi:hypothetical protein